MSDKTKLTFEITQEVNKILEKLVVDSGSSSKSEVLRKAIALMRAATDAKLAGKPFGVGKSDESMEMKILGV